MKLERWLSNKDPGYSFEDLGSISSTNMVAHNCLSFQFQGIHYPSLTSMDTKNTHGTYTYM